MGAVTGSRAVIQWIGIRGDDIVGPEDWESELHNLVSGNTVGIWTLGSIQSSLKAIILVMIHWLNQPIPGAVTVACCSLTG